MELKSYNDTHSRQCKEIISELSKRTRLLVKLLSDSSKLEPLLKKPINEMMQADQEWVLESIGDFTLFFKNMSNFVNFIYSCSLSIVPSIKEYTEHVNEFTSHIKSLGLNLELHSKKGLKKQCADLVHALESKAPYLCKVIVQATAASLKKMASNKDLLSNMRSENVAQLMQVGHNLNTVDDLMKLENDKLIFFKKSHLIPDSFVLTINEEMLLNTLFNEYPLDSDLTLYDLLSFALYDRIEKLRDLIAVDQNAIVDKIQKEIGTYCFMLFFGMIRSDPGTIKLMGPADTDDALGFSFTPSKFIEKLYIQLEFLTLCGPQIKSTHSSKAQSLIQTRQKEFQSKLSETIFPIQKLWTKILKSDFYLVLLSRSLDSYVGADSLDHESSNSFETFVNYCKFHKTIFHYAGSKSYFGNQVDFNKLPAIRKNPSKQTIQHIKKILLIC